MLCKWEFANIGLLLVRQVFGRDEKKFATDFLNFLSIQDKIFITILVSLITDLEFECLTKYIAKLGPRQFVSVATTTTRQRVRAFVTNKRQIKVVGVKTELPQRQGKNQHYFGPNKHSQDDATVVASAQL